MDRVGVLDLLCVLWLSGIHKEDLDVNMLTKLHRHNVTMQDMNNETLQRECLLKNNLESFNATTPNKEILEAKNSRHRFVSEIRSHPDSNPVGTATTSSNGESKEAGREKLRYNISQIDHINSNVINTKSTISQNVILQSVIEYTTLFPMRKGLMNGDRPMSQDSAQPNIAKMEDFLKIWRRLAYDFPNKTSSEEVTTTPVTITETTVIESTTDNPPKANGSTQSIDQLVRLVAEYMSKNNIVTTSTEATSPIDRSENFGALYRILMGKVPNKDMLAKLEKEVKKNVINLSVSTNVTPKTNYHEMNQSVVLSSDTRDFDKMKIDNSASLEHILKLNNHFKIYAPIYLYPHNITQARDTVNDTRSDKTEGPYRKVGRISDNSSNSFALPENSTNTNLTISEIQPKENQNPILTKNIIKEISDNVKALVLRDLRKELDVTTATTPAITKALVTANTSITTPTTTKSTAVEKTISIRITSSKASTTTSATPSLLAEFEQIKNIANVTTETKQVMDKFLQLFEQIKAIHETTIITSGAKYKVTKLKNEYFNISSDLNHPHKPVSFTKDVNIGHIEYSKDPNLRHVNSAPSSSTTFPPLDKEMSSKTVHIIQTNSNEIAPLAIPVAKSMRYMHPIKVVTTRYPNLIEQRYKNSPWKHIPNMHPYVSNFDDFYNRYNYPNFTSPSISHSDNDRHSNKNRYDLRPHEQARHIYQEPAQHPNYRENYLNKYEMKTNEDIIPNMKNRFRDIYGRESLSESNHGYNKDRVRHQHHDRMSYHERLEKTEDSQEVSDERREQKRDTDRKHHNIASRHQIPLNRNIANRRPKNGDDNYKKFLKTQKKVNDMLERILSTRALPPSVETA